MKRILISLICLFVFSQFLKAQAMINFSDSKKNFGFVKQGKIVEMKFELINKGNQPLILTGSKVECSCTEVLLPKEPVLPGKSAFVIVKFNTLTVYDRQDRIVEIESNAANGIQKIRFKGVVLRK